MTYAPDLKELGRLGTRLKRLRKDTETVMEEIKAEVRAAKSAGISDEKIAGAVKLSRLTVARMKADDTSN